MKQFNLEEYKKNPNRKVITRDGRFLLIIILMIWQLAALLLYIKTVDLLIGFK